MTGGVVIIRVLPFPSVEGWREAPGWSPHRSTSPLYAVRFFAKAQNDRGENAGDRGGRPKIIEYRYQITERRKEKAVFRYNLSVIC